MLNLVGVTEIAGMFGVTKQAVNSWKIRDDKFPKPVARLSMGSVWLKKDVRAWARKTGRM